MMFIDSKDVQKPLQGSQSGGRVAANEKKLTLHDVVTDIKQRIVQRRRYGFNAHENKKFGKKFVDLVHAVKRAAHAERGRVFLSERDKIVQEFTAKVA